MVNWENYEEYMMLHLDGELDAEAELAFLSFIAGRPELEEELHLIRSTKLEPDPQLVFTAKESLLKPVAPPKRIALGLRWQHGLAAAILLALVLLARSAFLTEDSGKRVARVAPVPAVPTPSREATSAQAPVPANHQPKAMFAAQSKPSVNLVHEAQRPVPEPDHFSTISPVRAEIQVPEAARPSDIAVVQQPEEPLTMHEPEKGRFLSWLPVNEEKKEGLQSLKENIDEKLEKAKNIRNNLKDTEFALRVGNKDLLVINF